MTANENALNWFEIPAADFNRAKLFYQTIFDIEMREREMGGMKMAMFPADGMNGKISGAVVYGGINKPSQDGPKIYLNGNPDLTNALSKIEDAGGKVSMPKTDIGEGIGFMAFFTDSEGNSMALHSNK